MSIPRIIYRSTDPQVIIPRCSIFTQIFSRSFDGGKPAFIEANTGRTLTRGDVYADSLRLGWSLRNTLQQKRGMVMALFSQNSITWPIVLLGGIAAGLKITPINPSYTSQELRHQLEDSGAFHIFTHPTLVENVAATLKLMKLSEAEIQHRIIVLPDPTQAQDSVHDKYRRFQSLLGSNRLKSEELFNGSDSDDTALLCYSSGTTGKSKGVELTHYSIVSVLCSVLHRFGYVNSEEGSILLSVLPFYHVYGLVKLILIPFFVGCPQVIMARFIPEDFCAYIERYKITASLIAPPVLVVLANHPTFDNYDMRSLQVLLVAAAPIGSDLIMRVHQRWKKQGAYVKIVQGYGMTETSPTCTLQKTEDFPAKLGSIGGLIAGLEARIVKDNNADANEGEQGELWIRGPNVMKGYLNNATATRDTITDEGWLKTGDIAIVDKDGDFTIVDRKKELIKYKGFQVPPAELESVLLTHPEVADAGVIGIWSESEATELPLAHVVLHPHQMTKYRTSSSSDKERFSKEIQTWFESQVARHKFLRGGVVIVDAIPKSAAGKILRKDLRELYKKKGGNAFKI